jgi:hypothetical protein
MDSLQSSEAAEERHRERAPRFLAFRYEQRRKTKQHREDLADAGHRVERGEERGMRGEERRATSAAAVPNRRSRNTNSNVTQPRWAIRLTR